MVPVTEPFQKATRNLNVLADLICAAMSSMILGYHSLPGQKTHHFQELEKLSMKNIFTGMTALALIWSKIMASCSISTLRELFC